jgi:hypothetical protein
MSRRRRVELADRMGGLGQTHPRAIMPSGGQGRPGSKLAGAMWGVMKKLDLNLWQRIVFFFSSPEKRAMIAVKKAFDEGIGIEQGVFDLRADPDALIEEMLLWADRAVYTSRTPYGIAAFRPHLMFIAEDDTVLREKWLSAFNRDGYREYARAKLASEVREEIAAGPGLYLQTSLLRLGDALKAAVFDN